jgi:hypothetical protein
MPLTANSLDWKPPGGSPQYSPGGPANLVDRASKLESQVVPHQEISSHLGRRFARGTDPGAPRASRWSNLGARIATAVAWLAATQRRIVSAVRALGPIAAIALIVPGGSLIALFWLGLRHRKAFSSSGSR